MFNPYGFPLIQPSRPVACEPETLSCKFCDSRRKTPVTLGETLGVPPSHLLQSGTVAFVSPIVPLCQGGPGTLCTRRGGETLSPSCRGVQEDGPCDQPRGRQLLHPHLLREQAWGESGRGLGSVPAPPAFFSGTGERCREPGPRVPPRRRVAVLPGAVVAPSGSRCVPPMLQSSLEAGVASGCCEQPCERTAGSFSAAVKQTTACE